MASNKSPEERIRAYRRIIPEMTDSHFHSEIMADRGVPLDETFSSLSGGEAAWLIDIAVIPGTVEKRKRLCVDYDKTRFATGIHPGSVAEASLTDLLAVMDQELQSAEVVAAGEMGLDQIKMYASTELQQDAFEAQLHLANKHRKPVVIHNRAADEQIYETLRRIPLTAGGIMHCFSSGEESVRSALDLGLHISFAGNVTYSKGSEAIQAACRLVPEDRLLLETDAPFLAPQAVRGRPNTPAYLGHTYEFVARLRGTTAENIAVATKENLVRLLSLSQKKGRSAGSSP